MIDAVARRRVATEIAVVAFFVAVASAWWWPLPLHLLDGQLESPPIDSAYNQWILGWGAHALTTAPLHYFDANAYHPHPGVLAWGDHLFFLALLVVPLRPVLGLVGAYNVLLVGSTAASAYTCYLLVRLVTERRAVSVLAGVLWSCSAYRLVEYAHLQILATAPIPLVFLFAEHLRRRRRLRDAVGLAASAWAVLATNVYLGMSTVLAFGVYGLAVLVRRRPDVRAILRIGLAWAVALVLAFPLYLPGIRLQARRHLVRGLTDQSPATLEAFRPLPPPGHLAQTVSGWFGERLAYRGNYATPGLVTLVVLAAALAHTLARRRAGRAGGRPPSTVVATAFVAVTGFAFLAALGPGFSWYGRELARNPLFLALYHLVPGYDALRIPHRWLLIVSFGLSVVAAITVAPLADRLRRPLRIGAVVALSALAVVEQSPAPWRVTAGYRSADEPVYAWLRHQPDRGAIVELPISADIASPVTQELEAKRLYYSAFHLRDRVGGGISPHIEASYVRNALLVNELGRDPRALAALRSWRVDLVFFDESDQARYEGAEPAAAVLARLDHDPGLRRLVRVGDTTVYRVRR